MNESDKPPMAADTAQPATRPFALSMPLMNRRDLLVRAALESALIVLSVFLALFLDEWRAERELDARLNAARTYLVREIRTNRAALQADPVLPYHIRTKALLVDLLSGPGPARDAALVRFQSGEFQGVHPFRAQDVVWNSLRTTEAASRLPPEQLFLLAEIYDAQADLEAISGMVYGSLVQPSADFRSEAYQQSQLTGIVIYFNDVIPAEQALVRRYNLALQRLETPRGSGR